MRKKGHTGRTLKILSYMMAAWMAFLQPCVVLAAEMSGPEELPLPKEEKQTEEVTQPEEISRPEEGSLPKTEDTASVKYIVAFGALAEEDSYFPCMYKPALEELPGFFPETVPVWLDGEEEAVELAVTWECEEDFDATEQPCYLFYPKWDETQYAVAEEVKDSVEMPVITVEVPQAGGVLQNPEEAKSSLYQMIQKKAVLASVYLCDEYEVKESPSYDGGTVHTVVSGQSVQITDVEMDEYGGVWYQVLLYQNGAEYRGYVEREYLATSDEDFARWEETYLDLSAVPMVMAFSAGYSDIDQFPASYQNALYALKEKHPEWTFIRMDTGLDWNTAIAGELGDKSWISSSGSGSWQNGSAPQYGWSYASEGIIKYYMDPRNFLDESHIFQFEHLIYNSSYHTTDAVQEMLNGSFMASAIPGDGRTYAQAFTAIGQEVGVSSFHLASRVLQEQGVRGSSALISGTYPGYEGYYNFFNVSASGTGDAETIRRGLSKAKMEGWNTRYASLYGGAKIIGNQYILFGQDTLYLEKFNVASGKYANYTHQYMQNIEAPCYEASKIYKAYQKAGVLERRFDFKIPVYENMPASACAPPEKTDVITLDRTSVSSLEVDKSVTLVPCVNGSKADHMEDMTFTSSNPAAAVVDAQGKVTALAPGDTIITCARNGASSASCTVTVVKADPVVSTPVLSPVTYREGIKLSDVALPSGWAWMNGDIVLSVGTPSYAAVYTPADTTKYNAITKNISFTVTKTVPECHVPTGLEIKNGETLGSIALPDGFSWESDTETVLMDAGEYTFYVIYNPDENNYYIVRHIPVIVQVKEKESGQPSGGNGGGTSGNDGTAGGSGTRGNGGTAGGSGTSGNGGTVGGSGTSTGSESSAGAGNVDNPGNAGSFESGDGNGVVAGTVDNSENSGNAGNPGRSDNSGGGTETEDGNGVSSGDTDSGTDNSSGSDYDGIPQERVSDGNAQHPAAAGNAAIGNTSSSETIGNIAAGSAVSGDTTTGASLPSATTGNTQSSAVSERNNGGTNNAEENTSSEAEAENAGQPAEQEYFRPAVMIPMEDTTILTTEKMQMAKTQNFDLLLDMGGAVTWSIDVDSIDESTISEVDMGVEPGTDNVPQELISTVIDGNKYLEITLAHQGMFAFEPVLHIALGKEYSGKYANLFYYAPETETLEFICDAIIDSDGVASLRFEHASCYLIVVSDQSMSGVSFDDETVNPVTRWIIAGVFICMLLIVAGYGIFFFLKKRREAGEEEEYEDEEEEEVEEYATNDEIDVEGDVENDITPKTDNMPGRDLPYSEEKEEEESDDGYFDEDDWIEDEDWEEPEPAAKTPQSASADVPTEDDWLDYDEWNAEDDWIEDDEWVE
ncbi:MAG: Ig-like domain-containing protein [Blautia sp.]|nr:Ig-like domain-containing protein [Blautia sp.]MCM1201281.1 Ig-like domain-containing protein [Bacteroides fragilis]